jgi:probable rRNA maturation factor
MIDLVFSAEGGSASGGKNYTSPRKTSSRGRLRAPGNSFFKKVLETAAQELKLKDKIEVSVNLVGEDKIRELNKKYRKKDKPTDVLSFPMGDKYLIRNTKYIIRDVGDIFICLSIAKNEAKRENITIKEKLAQLAAHGFLHLLGYDHEVSEVCARKMFKLENRILKQLSF